MLQLLLETAYAAGGSGDSNNIPWRIIITQIGNYTVFVLLLAFLLRNRIKDYFQAKKENFEAAFKKAEYARQEAERKQKEVLAQLEELNQTFNQSIEEAKAQAEKTKENMIEEAKNTAAAIQKESEKTYQNQLQQAVQRLKKDLLEESTKNAEDLIRSKMQKQDHENLQDNLVKSFGAIK